MEFSLLPYQGGSNQDAETLTIVSDEDVLSVWMEPQGLLLSSTRSRLTNLQIATTPASLSALKKKILNIESKLFFPSPLCFRLGHTQAVQTGPRSKAQRDTNPRLPFQVAPLQASIPRRHGGRHGGDHRRVHGPRRRRICGPPPFPRRGAPPSPAASRPCFWFHGSLSIEISNGHRNMRTVRRKVALLLGQWISEIKGDTLRLVYHALVGLLQDNDIAVRLAPCSSLCYLFQESSFSELDLFECLPTCWTMCFKLTEDVQEFDSKVQVLNFISVLIEHVGDKIMPFASQLSQFFQKIWDESAGESLLQIQLIAALTTFVSSLGYQSPLSYHMLIPILQSSINVDSPDALNLLEDSVLLWEVALSNAPSIVPQLLDLFPYLVGIMNRRFDHVEAIINIIEDHTFFGGS